MLNFDQNLNTPFNFPFLVFCRLFLSTVQQVKQQMLQNSMFLKEIEDQPDLEYKFLEIVNDIETSPFNRLSNGIYEHRYRYANIF